MMLIAAIKLHIIMYDLPIYNLKLRIDFRLILRNTQNMRKQSSILAIYGFTYFMMQKYLTTLTKSYTEMNRIGVQTLHIPSAVIDRWVNDCMYLSSNNICFQNQITTSLYRVETSRRKYNYIFT